MAVYFYSRHVSAALYMGVDWLWIIAVSGSSKTSSKPLHVAYITSMPTLACSNCYLQREEFDRLKGEVTGLRRDLKATKKALEASQKMERALRERYAAYISI